MRICIIASVFPPDIGGPATYVPAIARALVERGHQVKVIAVTDPAHLQCEGRYPFPVFRIPRWPVWRRALSALLALWQHGRDADVIYANGMFLEAVLAKAIVRKPVVMKIVGDEAWERSIRRGWTQDGFEDFQRRRQRWQAELLKLLRSWYVRRADCIIVPSCYLKGIVEGWGVSREKCRVVYNAIEPVDEIRPVQVPLRTPFKLITVGRLVPWKRVDGILRAIASLGGVGLVIVGDGPERPRLEALVEELGLEERVFFAGKRSRQETLALMAACDAFILNSSYEGLPHTLLEAMQVGLPIIATAVGGVPEVVQDGVNGALVEVDSTARLAAAIRAMVNSSPRKTPTGDARSTMANFSWDRVASATEKVLLEALGN